MDGTAERKAGVDGPAPTLRDRVARLMVENYGDSALLEYMHCHCGRPNRIAPDGEDGGRRRAHMCVLGLHSSCRAEGSRGGQSYRKLYGSPAQLLMRIGGLSRRGANAKLRERCPDRPRPLPRCPSTRRRRRDPHPRCSRRETRSVCHAADPSPIRGSPLGRPRFPCLRHPQ